jgi:hypothetical protein
MTRGPVRPILGPLTVDGDLAVGADPRPHLDRMAAHVTVLDERVPPGLLIDLDLGRLAAVRAREGDDHLPIM